MTESKPEANPVRTRSVGVLEVDANTTLTVDHVFYDEDEPELDKIGLLILEGNDEAGAAMSRLQAQWLANRLAQAVNENPRER